MRLLMPGRSYGRMMLRPTWHFVKPCDIGWMLKLSAPEDSELWSPLSSSTGDTDAAVLRRSRKTVGKALADGGVLTRVEIAELLRRAKIDTSDIRMNFFMMDAELEGSICSGPRLGKQFTYTLLSSRVGRQLEFSGDVGRWGSWRGGSLSQPGAGDGVMILAWWGGMTVGDAKRGLEVAKGSWNAVEVEGWCIGEGRMQ